jgi:hypothetical protein
MKFQLTEMIKRPEPSSSPVAILYMALVAAACLASALLSVVKGA